MDITDLFPVDPAHINYLINWSIRNKIIYVETPKVGCTSIKRILQYSEVNCDESALPIDVHERESSPLISPNVDIEHFLECMHSDEYFKFSFVRNPFTRIMSCYIDKFVNKIKINNNEVNLLAETETKGRMKKLGIDSVTYLPTFDEFIERVYNQEFYDMDVHWAPQSFLLGLPKVKYDYIGRFEYFEDSINYIVKRNNLHTPPNLKFFGTQHKTNADSLLNDFFTPLTIKRVQEIYHNDFAFLGYGWSI